MTLYDHFATQNQFNNNFGRVNSLIRSLSMLDYNRLIWYISSSGDTLII